MEVLFGDGSGGVFTFFKDKGGKMNHMHLRMNVKSKVYARLVYEDGSDIPEMFLNLEDVPLLQMEIRRKKASENSEWQPLGVCEAFCGKVEIRFKLKHVSRRHHNRKFIMMFHNNRTQKKMFETPVIEVRSKLKLPKSYASQKARSAVSDTFKSKNNNEYIAKQKDECFAKNGKRKRVVAEKALSSSSELHAYTGEFKRIKQMVGELQVQVGVVMDFNRTLVARVQELEQQVRNLSDLNEIDIMNSLPQFEF